MKLLFIFFEELKPSNGVSKKVLAQCGGLRANGIEVDLLSLKSIHGELVAILNGDSIYSYGNDKFKYLRLLVDFAYIVKYVKDNHVDAVYARFSRTNPLMILLYKALKRDNVKVLLEIPTYPYDAEKADKKPLFLFLYKTLLFKIDVITRNFLKYYIDRVISVQNYDTIFGVPTVKISNAVNLRNIPIRKRKEHEGYNLIAVAQLGDWHGYDRLIEGMGQYYKNGGKDVVHFYIIGNNDSVINDYKKIVTRYGIEHYVHFEGPKEGKELDAYFDSADFAIGSIGGHRKGLTDAKPLKCVEYAARGIPFIYSENNSDFDNCSFVRKVSQDDSPINVNNLILSLNNIMVEPETMRKYVEDNLTWDNQMKKIVNEIAG